MATKSNENWEMRCSATKEQRGAAPVIFGEPGDSNLLGVVTLEALGYVLDPLKRELRALPMLLAGLGGEVRG